MPFPHLAERVEEVRSRIDAAAVRGGHGQSVAIVAVTKTLGADAVLAAHELGIERIGENRVQEALAKMEQVQVPVSWHLIGHLQRNKVKAVPSFALVHSVDSARLADAIHELGERVGRPIPVLVQVNTSGEDSKGGYTLSEMCAEAERLRPMRGLRVEGVMTMAPLDADERTLRTTFAGARRAREILAGAGHPAGELSMGMSGDFEIAVEEGATLVRLGTILFGARAA